MLADLSKTTIKSKFCKPGIQSLELDGLNVGASDCVGTPVVFRGRLVGICEGAPILIGRLVGRRDGAPVEGALVVGRRVGALDVGALVVDRVGEFDVG